MAFYEQDEDENQQDPNAQGAAQQAPSPTGSQTIAGGSSAAPGGSSVAPKAAGAPDKPGNFVGLKDYLNANRVQSQKLGNQVSGNLNQNISQASQALGGLQGAFGEKVKSGQIANLDTATDEGKGLIDQAAKEGKVTDEGKQRYGEIANAQYKGPNSLAEATDIYQPVVAQVNKANTDAGLTTTEEGRQQLLRNISKSPSYTAGAQRFDSYLLNNPESMTKLGDARKNAAGLQTQLGTEESTATDTAKKAAQQAQSVQDAIRSAFGKFDDPSTPENEALGALGNYQGEVQGNLSQAQQYGNDLANHVNNGQMTMDDLARLGLKNDSTYGIDFKNYFQQGVPTAAGVTTPEEKARYDALLALGGVQGGMYSGSAPDEFGNYKPTSNLDAFQSAVADQKKLYEVTQAKQKANDLTNFLRHGRQGVTIGGGIMDNYLKGIEKGNNADEILAALQQMEAYEKSQGINSNYYGQQSALRNYLTNDLQKARDKTLVGNTPDLPTKNDGSIDWGAIKAPKGK